MRREKDSPASGCAVGSRRLAGSGRKGEKRAEKPERISCLSRMGPRESRTSSEVEKGKDRKERMTQQESTPGVAVRRGRNIEIDKGKKGDKEEKEKDAVSTF